MSRAREFADLAGSADAGGITGRNVFINGNYDVWQRGTSFTDVAGIWHYGFADRWNGHNDGADAGTFSQSTTVPNSGSKYSLLMTGASGVTNTNVSQRVESVNMQGIRAANSMTLSGYVRSATAGKIIQFYGLAPTATDNFSSYTFLGSMFSKTTMSGNGSGGTIGIGLTDADTWYYFTATATNVNSQTNFDKGFAMYAAILGQTSSSHQVYFSQLQLEAGEQATPFEHEPYGVTLQKAQRYYQHLGAQFHGKFYQSTKTILAGQTIVTMRTVPTVTIESKSITIDEMGVAPRTFTSSAGALYGVTKDGIGVYDITGTHGGTVGNLVSSHGNFFKVDAEL